jgi:hypothetical protein
MKNKNGYISISIFSALTVLIGSIIFNSYTYIVYNAIVPFKYFMLFAIFIIAFGNLLVFVNNGTKRKMIKDIVKKFPETEQQKIKQELEEKFL